MSYPRNLKASNRKLSERILISSTQFTYSYVLTIGARMALFNYNDEIIVWSAFPFGSEVVNALNELMNVSRHEFSSFNVTYLIVPNKNHKIAAQSFKQAYPNLKIISPSVVDLSGTRPDYSFQNRHANRVLNREDLKSIGFTSPAILDNFEFVYLPSHVNSELVVYNKELRAVFSADIIFNMSADKGPRGELEQYSNSTGYEEATGSLFLSLAKTFLTPYSWVGIFLSRIYCNVWNSRQGLSEIFSWDFKIWVPSHGNLIEENAKEVFSSIFKPYLDQER